MEHARRGRVSALAGNRPALEAALATARATVATLEVALATADEPFDEVLSLADITAQFGYGREAILAAVGRGELDATRGPRRRVEIRRSELERWRASRPVEPRLRRRTAEIGDLAAWEAEADRVLELGQTARGAEGPRHV
jgi:hypothetical protein